MYSVLRLIEVLPLGATLPITKRVKEAFWVKERAFNPDIPYWKAGYAFHLRAESSNLSL